MLGESSLLVWEGVLENVKVEINLAECLIICSVDEVTLSFLPNNYCFYMSTQEEKKCSFKGVDHVNDRLIIKPNLSLLVMLKVIEASGRISSENFILKLE